ncbi:MAG: NADH-dependent [FeFe] hydrogenase, group A6 [Candidatus Omnitrophica bacterium]|nr:NADH-dependent [FeFe] hydrogenase, group A6 [Candidatus Omnitrophota bacterium]MDD5670551.1 NADH-dependent [FeFe] hydrogenase, group A6 [Candidatus Omnitrophota bacterium]
MSKQITMTIDGVAVSVPDDYTIMQAADSAGIHIPRLCYHSKLSQFGACRICVVDVEGMKNYAPACSTQVKDGMILQTHSAGIRKARKVLIELLLNNHPRDCQVCGKSGECTLQEMAESFGVKSDEFSFEGERKTFETDRSSVAVRRDSEKCILCGKCVRVCSEIQGANVLTFSHRGFRANVVPAYNLGLGESVCTNCGQCINVCPTGALLEHDNTEEVWHAIHDPNKVVMVQIAPAVRVAIGEGFGNEPGKDMTYETVTALRMLGFDIVFDTQFSADLTIIEEGHEFIRRLTQKGKLPMITSCSPGWIKFCETFHPEFLENISTCKSPQQMMGAVIKTYYADKSGIYPAKIYSVSIMPCTAKKFEAARPEMNSSGYQDVDAVLTTRELIKMIKEAGIDFNRLKKSEFDHPLGESSGAAPIFGATGGVMEAALRTVYEVVTGKELAQIDFTDVRGLEGIREAVIPVNEIEVRVAVTYGLANVHKLLTEIEQGKRQYHFIEIMTCPGGCIGGGGQPYPAGEAEALDTSVYEKRAQGLYGIDERKVIRKSHLNPDITKIYQEFLKEPLGKVSHKLLHTHYHARHPKGVPARIKDTVNLFKAK